MRAAVIRLLATLLGAAALPPAASAQIRGGQGSVTQESALRGLTRFHISLNQVDVPSWFPARRLEARLQDGVRAIGIEPVSSGEIPVLNADIPLRSNPPDLTLDLHVFQMVDGTAVALVRLHVEQPVKIVRGEDDVNVDPEDEEEQEEDPDDVFVRATTWQQSGYVYGPPSAEFLEPLVNQVVDDLIQRFRRAHTAANPPAPAPSRTVFDVIFFWR